MSRSGKANLIARIYMVVLLLMLLITILRWQ